jgi:hypothetical protein
MRLVLRANALFDFVVGSVLGLATFDWLYATIDMHQPNPAPFAQLAGIFFYGFAYLLWIAPRDVRLARAVAAASGLVHGLVALLVVVWEIPGRITLPRQESAIIIGIAVVSAAFALAEGAIASRNVAMLLPPD